MSLVTSIQKYSIHDGDGIRTSVFFKGCHLRCAWCHNPETQSYSRQLSCNQERCIGCGSCACVCPKGAVQIISGKAVTDPKTCAACGACIDACHLNLREVIGKEYTVNELFRELIKDEMFYDQSGGGVTLSGGEVMTMDMDFIEALCRKLDRYGISITIDTCGQAPYENYKRLLPYVDTFLYDIKTLDTELHKKYMGTGNELILDNLKRLSRDGARIYIRIPVIREVNGSDVAMTEIISYLTKEHIQTAQVNLLPYHNTGNAKYEHLCMANPGLGLHAPSREEMEHFTELFQEAGFGNVKIGG